MVRPPGAWSLERDEEKFWKAVGERGMKID